MPAILVTEKVSKFFKSKYFKFFVLENIYSIFFTDEVLNFDKSNDVTLQFENIYLIFKTIEVSKLPKMIDFKFIQF